MATDTEHSQRHGRSATTPLGIPKSGWRDIALRVYRQIGFDNIGIVSAGVAFYALLAVFPTLSAIVSTYGLVFDPSDVQAQMEKLVGILPAEGQQLLLDQLETLTQGSSAGLGLGVFFGLLVALWSSTRGVKALITALNIVYDETERRGFIQLSLISLGFMLCIVVFVVFAITSIVVIPPLLNSWDWFSGVAAHLAWIRWPFIAVSMLLGLGIIYRFAPNRTSARWTWLSVGSVVATVLWLLGSWLFSLYVTHFGSYNETYGSIGAVVILLMWFYVSTWIVLFGAEINAEIEHQTAVDSTVGDAKPMGERGAQKADTLGEHFSQDED